MLKWQIEVRKARGKQIVEQKRRKITQEGDDWHVTKTNSDKSFYTVKLYQEPPSCTCPDYKDTGEKCKHIYAVQYLNGDADAAAVRPLPNHRGT